MAGAIKVGNNTYTFEQFVGLKDLTLRDEHLLAAQGFLRSWLSGQSEYILSTSGSTGKPKSIDISREQMMASANMTANALGLKQGDSALLCINSNFIGGKMMLVRAVTSGLQLSIIPPSSNPLDHLDRNAQFDFAAFVPIQVKELLKTETGRSLLNSIKKIIIGGGAVDESLVAALQEIQTAVYSTYGMTETVSHIALKKLNQSDKSEFFHLLPSVEVKLDERDCLCIKAPMTNNQWLTTNDIVQLNRDDSFKWLGRFDNVINSGGIKIQIEELEALIRAILPDVPFMITSKADEDYGEAVALLFEGQEINDKQKKVIKDKLPKFHCPKIFKAVNQLPMTTAGKPDRSRARVLINS